MAVNPYQAFAEKYPEEAEQIIVKKIGIKQTMPVKPNKWLAFRPAIIGCFLCVMIVACAGFEYLAAGLGVWLLVVLISEAWRMALILIFASFLLTGCIDTLILDLATAPVQLYVAAKTGFENAHATPTPHPTPKRR